MTISFFQPDDVPQPPDKVKIEHLDASAYPDGWRVKVELHVTPFQKRPSLEIALVKKEAEESGKIVAHLSIIETMHPKMEFTMHIRDVDTPQGDYWVKTVLFFREAPEEGSTENEPLEPVDEKSFALTIAD